MSFALRRLIRSLRKQSDDEKINRELRDASMALWVNVIQRSPIASYATHDQAERELTKILQRVSNAVIAYDKLHHLAPHHISENKDPT